METPWLDALFQSRPRHKVRLDPFRSKSRVDASLTVRVKATYYPMLAKVYVPNTPFRKLQEGMVASKKLDRKKRNQPQSEDDKERSMRRSRQRVSDYILCNRFELFCTFTFKEDRDDVDKCRQKMSDWLKNQRSRKGKFGYLIVAETHKSGALHFHALFRDYHGELNVATNPHTGKPIFRKGKPVYNLASYTLGHTTVQKIGDSPQDHTRVSWYIRKYLTKGMPLFFGKRRYWASRGLVMPKVDYEPGDWYLHTKPDKVYEHEYGKTYFFLNSYVIPDRYKFQLYQVQTLPGILDDHP